MIFLQRSVCIMSGEAAVSELNSRTDSTSSNMSGEAAVSELSSRTISKSPNEASTIPGASTTPGTVSDEEEVGGKGKSKDVHAGKQESPERDLEDASSEANKTFECNICLDNATDPVISYCGHLFCWPCLHTWFELNSQQQCPVCKANIGKDKVVPLYGRGNSSKQDPREKPIPPRPKGQRPAASSSNQRFRGTNTRGGPNVTFSAGFGVFPSLLTMHFGSIPTNNIFGSQQDVENMSIEEQQHLYMSRALLCFAVFILLQLLMY
eukprot:CFRG1359T1